MENYVGIYKFFFPQLCTMKFLHNIGIFNTYSFPIIKVCITFPHFFAFPGIKKKSPPAYIISDTRYDDTNSSSGMPGINLTRPSLNLQKNNIHCVGKKH